MLNKYQLAIKKLVELLYTTPEGEHIRLYDTQVKIIESIYNNEYRRVVVGTPTQYGKSLSVAIGSLLYLKRYKKKVQIVAPTNEQANIIMNYVRYFVSIRPELLDGLVGVGTVEQLRTQKRQEKLQWMDGSAIGIQSADAGSNADNIEKAGKRIMGFGGDLVIIDETALIPDLIIGKILRMLGKSKESKLVLLGNPFSRNYFYKAYKSDNFYKIWIDADEAVREGRFSKEFIQEMKQDLDEDLYKILYDVKFIIGTTSGYIKQKDLDEGREKLEVNKQNQRWIKEQEMQPVVLGCDVASGKGKDYSVIVIRQGYRILDIIRNNLIDTQQFALQIANVAREYNANSINVDVVGIGHGVVDRLNELGLEVNPVNAGGKPSDSRYYNVRAELWTRVKKAIKEGNIELPDDPNLLEELLTPKREFKNTANGVVEILEDKEKTKIRLGRSPDIADALSLTFYEGGGIVFAFA